MYVFLSHFFTRWDNLFLKTFSFKVFIFGLLWTYPGLSDWPNEPGKYSCRPEEQAKGFWFQWYKVAVVRSGGTRINSVAR
jgi:hypothetical protein